MSSELGASVDREDATASGRAVVVGVGNLLLSDEGLGVHAIRALQAGPQRWIDQVTFIEAGTALFDVLADCRHADPLILIDALRAGHPPGTVYRVRLDAGFTTCEAGTDVGLSLHGWGVLDALSAAARAGLLPANVVLMGIEPAALELGTSLSTVVARSLDALLDAVEGEVLGCSHRPDPGA